jgi:hypothetical protein
MSVAVRTLPDAGMVAVTVATVCDAFGSVATSNVAVDCPASMTTVEGTSTLAALLDSATSTPVAAAGAASERVPVTERPVATDDADSDNPCSVRREILNVAVWLTPEYVAVIVAVDDVDAATVSIENVWFVDPAPINTLDGTVATAVLLDSVTRAPPVGAAADKVTVPVTASPPAMD